MRLPVDVRDIIRSGSEMRDEREKPIRIAVFVEVDSPDELLDVVQSRFRPYTANAYLHVEVAEPGTRLVVDPSADAVVCLIGSGGASIVESLADARERAVPAAAVALAEDSMEIADRIGHPYRDTFADPDAVRVVDVDLGEWLVERIGSKRLAMAHNFEFMRRAVAVEYIKNTAFQNAVIGAVAFIPGADMPLMTANQSKMLLQVAAAYGEQLGVERWKELAGVVGGAFVLRTIARQGVAFVPGFGWAIKAGIGYSGTVAMGYATIKYFESDADLGDLQQRLEQYGEQVMGKIRSMSKRELRRARSEAAETSALPTRTESAVASTASEPSGSTDLSEEHVAGDA